MPPRDKEGRIVCCEHNRRGLRLYSLYGRFSVYTCALDKRRHSEWLAGWNEPCYYPYSECRRSPEGANFILESEMLDNEERIRQDKKEHDEKLAEAANLRERAIGMLRKADKLETE